jgi:hypothetical protein
MFSTLAKFKWWIAIFIICLIPRVTLTILNAQSNDDHTDPIKRWIDASVYPAWNDCYECFQPPGLYVIIKTIAVTFSLTEKNEIDAIFKWLNFLIGIAILLLLFWMVCRLKLPSQLWTYLMALFWGLNPKLIAICAQMTNDPAIILVGLLFTYLLYKIILNQYKWLPIVSIILLIGIAPTIKGIGLLLTGFWGLLIIYLLIRKHISFWPKGLLIAFLSLTAFLFSLVYGGYYHKYKTIGKPFQTNWEAEYPPHFYEEDSCNSRLGVTTVFHTYFTFRIFDLIRHPYLENKYETKPLHRSSFITLLYGQFPNVHYEQHPPTWKSKNPNIHLTSSISYVILLPLFVLFCIGLLKSIILLCNKQQSLYLKILTLIFLLFLAFVYKYSYTYRDFSFIKVVFLFPVFHAIMSIYHEGLKLCFRSAIVNKVIIVLTIAVIVIFCINLGQLVPLLAAAK